MKRIFMFYLALVFWGNISAQDLTLATFNCEFLNQRKVHLKYGLPYSIKKATKAEQEQWKSDAFRKQKFLDATQKVAAHIKTLNADIIGLTEAGNETETQALLDALKKIGTNYPYKAVCASKDNFTGQHVVLLSKYPLSNVESGFDEEGLYFLESDYDAVKSTGLSKALKATVTYNNMPINIFLAHLKSERGGEESDQKRLMQAEILRRLTIPYLQKGEHVIVMGDLNAKRKHNTLLTLRGFKDIHQELVQSGDSYFFEDNQTRWTYNYKGQYAQIDHILLSMPFTKKCNSNKNKKRGITTKIIETNNPEVSDHNALLVEFNFR